MTSTTNQSSNEAPATENANASTTNIKIDSSKKTPETEDPNDEATNIAVAGSASKETYGPNVKISNHPVLLHKISVLRSSSTLPQTFRHVLREITFHLGYEATSYLTTRPKNITVPVGHDHLDCVGKTLAERIALVPILRSGLGMVDAMLELLPNAGVHHIGMYKQNQLPVQYYQRLPRKCDADVAYVLDPVLASAQTIRVVVSILKKWGVAKIHVLNVICSKTGLQQLSTDHPDVLISVGEVDETLTDKGLVLPGLGDSGDRLFGTPMIDDEEDLMHISKRKRSI